MANKFKPGEPVIAGGKAARVESINQDGTYRCVTIETGKRKYKPHFENYTEAQLSPYPTLAERRTVGIFRDGLH
jgi:hypothetical protein